MTPEQATALRIARMLIANGVSTADALTNPAVPVSTREFVRGVLEASQTRTLRPVSVISANSVGGVWLDTVDRRQWYYWPALRDFLISVKGWDLASIASIDDETDKILRQLASPTTQQFDVRGLVLGYVQSGKTANFTALISKAADVGYRLVVVLSGTDNGLRRQTQLRLNRELVGYSDNRPDAVPLPPADKLWHQLTNEEPSGDFDAGRVNYTPLNGTQPVLLVMKKNGPRLRRLHTWLDSAPPSVGQSLPLLVIDDEADQASPDTRGDRLAQIPDPEDAYEDPSVINGLVRRLVDRFERCAYVAYTATPFANILIPHDNDYHPEFGSDLYPKDFFVSLPKRDGYFGAEEFFGRFDIATEADRTGMDVIRSVPDADLLALDQATLPDGLKTALLDFVLTGAARRQRGQGNEPATMLIHTSSRTDEHTWLATAVREHLREISDEWRYQTDHIEPRLHQRWDSEFRPVTRAMDSSRDVVFAELVPHIRVFFESIRQNVREVNSRRGDMLDYSREPSLKVIVVGGNRLSRGLTLEGLLVSYFVRASAQYDTLMQMGRWFGYRGGYADLTRIHTTSQLRAWFHDLATVEHQLREDIAVYERQGLNPRELGMRILSHPAMLVTSPLKARNASSITIAQTYAGKVVQTFKFPFHRPSALAEQADANLAALRQFLETAGTPLRWEAEGPIWTSDGDNDGRVSVEGVLDFLRRFRIDNEVRSVSLPLICAYIERQRGQGELLRWTVAVKGRKRLDRNLGAAQWNVTGQRPDQRIAQISRTRLKSDPNSLGVITEPGDEEAGLSAEQLVRAREEAERGQLTPNPAARLVRSVDEGLLLLYPISRASGHDLAAESITRAPLFANTADANARDLVAFALSFPASQGAATVFGQGSFDFTTGTVAWREVE